MRSELQHDCGQNMGLSGCVYLAGCAVKSGVKSIPSEKMVPDPLMSSNQNRAECRIVMDPFFSPQRECETRTYAATHYASTYTHVMYRTCNRHLVASLRSSFD